MSELTMGMFFLGGGMPGAIFVLFNMRKAWRLGANVERIAASEGKIIDINFGLSGQRDFMLAPERLLNEGDSSGSRAAKCELVSFRKKFYSRHFAGTALMFAGALVGFLLGLFIYGA